jgi:hypothetical protein
VIGTDAVAKSAPDGYTLLLMSNTHTVNETLLQNKPYNLTRDFVGVAPINYSDLVLVAHPSVPATNVQQLVKLAKDQPGKLNYASSGTGTPYHMAGELFKSMSGTYIVHVPYKGSSGARTDVIGGQVQLMFDAVTTMTEQIKGGKVKAIATTGKKRSSVLPDVPTVDEAACRLRSHHLAGRAGAQGHAGAHRRAPERGHQQDRQPARRAAGLGKAGRDRDGHEPGGLRQVHAGRHRQVGQGHPVGQHQGRLMVQVQVLSGGAAHGLVRALQQAARATRARHRGHLRRRRHHARQAAGRRALRPADPERALIQELERQGHVQPGSARPLGRVRTGVAVKAGERHPPSVRRRPGGAAVQPHRRSTCRTPSSPPRASMFQGAAQLGLEQQMAGRLREYPNGATAMRELAACNEPGLVGCTQMTEILDTPGVDWVGALPKEFELATVYTAAVCTRRRCRRPPRVRRPAGVGSGTRPRPRKAAGFDPL